MSNGRHFKHLSAETIGVEIINVRDLTVTNPSRTLSYNHQNNTSLSASFTDAGATFFYLQHNDIIGGFSSFSSITTSNNPKIFSLTGNFTKIIGDVTVGNTGTSFDGLIKLYYYNIKENFSEYIPITLQDNLLIDTNYHSIPINIDISLNGPLYGFIVLENPEATAGYGINDFSYSLTFS